MATNAINKSPKPAKKQGIILPIALMIGPAVVLVAVIASYAVLNFLFSTLSGGNLDSVAPANPLQAALNIFLFFAGTLAIIGGLPSFIAGLILLLTRKG